MKMDIISSNIFVSEMEERERERETFVSQLIEK